MPFVCAMFKCYCLPNQRETRHIVSVAIKGRHAELHCISGKIKLARRQLFFRSLLYFIQLWATLEFTSSTSVKHFTLLLRRFEHAANNRRQWERAVLFLSLWRYARKNAKTNMFSVLYRFSRIPDVFHSTICNRIPPLHRWKLKNFALPYRMHSSGPALFKVINTRFNNDQPFIMYPLEILRGKKEPVGSSSF